MVKKLHIFGGNALKLVGQFQFLIQPSFSNFLTNTACKINVLYTCSSYIPSITVSEKKAMVDLILLIRIITTGYCKLKFLESFSVTAWTQALLEN